MSDTYTEEAPPCPQKRSSGREVVWPAPRHGLLLLLGHILDLGGDPEYGTVLGGALVLTAHVVLVFALVALYAAQAEQSGLLGSLGMVLSVVRRSSRELSW